MHLILGAIFVAAEFADQMRTDGDFLTVGQTHLIEFNAERTGSAQPPARSRFGYFARHDCSRRNIGSPAQRDILIDFGLDVIAFFSYLRRNGCHKIDRNYETRWCIADRTAVE